jgi:hypothetical protein
MGFKTAADAALSCLPALVCVFRLPAALGGDLTSERGCESLCKLMLVDFVVGQRGNSGHEKNGGTARNKAVAASSVSTAFYRCV